ncbi:MAG TPA: hypothetical protein VF676_12810 [Flavobacterium sp.]
MKKKLVLLLLLCTAKSFSQQVVNSQPLQLQRDRSAFQVVDTAASQVALFVSDKSATRALLLDNTMKSIDSLSTPRPDGDFDELLGYVGTAQKPVLVWGAGNAKKKILLQAFDFNTNAVSTKNVSIDLKEERILEKLSTAKAFYLVTVVKNSNIIKFYVFDAAGNMEERPVNMDKLRFFRSDTGRSTFYGVMGQMLNLQAPYAIKKIDAGSPTSLTEASLKRKCYLQGNKFYITNDANVDFTQVVTIDLDTFTATETFLKQPFIASDSRSDLNSNSFILGDKIYQIKLGPDQMFVTLKDFQDNTIKMHHVAPNTEITFRNSPMRQEGGDFDSSRILDKSSQFIRKVNNSNTGISCYDSNGKTLVTFGSVSAERANEAAMIGGMFGVAGILVAYAVANPTMDNFNSYANRKVVYVDCLFDPAGNHLDGPVPQLAFNKIRTYVEDKKISGQTLYRFGGDYFMGSYDKDGNLYTIRKFTDD